MPLGSLTIRSEPGAVRDALVSGLAATVVDSDADICVSNGPPTDAAAHVIVTGPLDDEVDVWDEAVAPQTVAGALWLTPQQTDAADAALAWIVLRLQMPTTPLSDLTDNNGRALRWSVASGCRVTFPGSQSVEVDSDDVKVWADAQQAVVDLGAAVQRVGGETADAVLNATQRLHATLEALGPLGASPGPTPELDAAVAEHLRQVQRSGFARWRGAKARAASLAAMQQAARDVAGQRLQQVLTTREQQVAQQARAAQDAGLEQAMRESIIAAVQSLALPVEPDFSKVPRSWATGASQPRRYVFVHEEHLESMADLGVAVRAAQIEPGQALCTIVASGFSLPALR